MTSHEPWRAFLIHRSNTSPRHYPLRRVSDPQETWSARNRRWNRRKTVFLLFSPTFFFFPPPQPHYFKTVNSCRLLTESHVSVSDCQCLIRRIAEKSCTLLVPPPVKAASWRKRKPPTERGDGFVCPRQRVGAHVGD